MFKNYIDFIINQIITDSEKLQYSYGWNFIIIPYIYWLIIFLLKYLILFKKYPIKAIIIYKYIIMEVAIEYFW